MARNRLSSFNLASLALGFAFLYLPIVILVIYSFNDSRLVTVWGGWSLRWYRELFNDKAMIEAAWMSLGVASASASIATLLGTLDRSLEEAAMDLGCNPLHAFLAVTLPLIAPAIVAGWMLAFTLSLDDLVIASFTTGPGSTTLPIRIYSEVRLGVKPEINAICTLVIALIAVVIVVASLASKLSSRQGESAAPL